MKKFIGIAAAAMIMMSGAAFAFDQVGSIDQYGQGNKAAIEQSGHVEQASIYQNGADNGLSKITQKGYMDQASVVEYGKGNTATITQTGMLDNASVYQQGANNDATVNQSGGMDTAIVNQFSSCKASDPANTANVTQSGCGDYANVYQNNEIVSAYCDGCFVFPRGANVATVGQSSSVAFATVSQVGQGNNATITQK